MNKSGRWNISRATSYRTVIGNIIKFANNEIKKLSPEKSYEERIIKAQEEPFWTAAKQDRYLNKEELKQVGLSD